MITVPPLTAFMYAVIKVNRYFSSALRYGSGRSGYLFMTAMICLWLWLILLMLPGLADFISSM